MRQNHKEDQAFYDVRERHMTQCYPLLQTVPEIAKVAYCGILWLA